MIQNSKILVLEATRIGPSKDVDAVVDCDHDMLLGAINPTCRELPFYVYTSSGEAAACHEEQHWQSRVYRDVGRSPDGQV